ncbi:MAG: glycosyltransferase [Myxococcota bacterium]
MPAAASVIVSTYDRPRHLERCLAGFRFQTRLDFEVLVADDGSGPETARTIEAAARASSGALRHLRQEDRGFRKCRILNQAVREAASDYLIFTDSDCCPHRRFVERHLAHRRPGHMLVGRSVKWGRRRSEALDPEAIRRGRHARIGARDLWDSLRKRNRYLPYGFSLPGQLGFRLVQHLKKNRSGRGGNFSAWKADLERVNGWNEDFESWGLEDVELSMRLRWAGVVPLLVINRALTFHLWHPEGDKRSRSARNAYNASKARGIPWCPNGLRGPGEAPLGPGGSEGFSATAQDAGSSRVCQRPR